MIGDLTITKITDEIHELMNDYVSEISKVFDRNREIVISFKAKVVLEGTENIIQTKISFVESKIENTKIANVNEVQMHIQFPETEEKECKK